MEGQQSEREWQENGAEDTQKGEKQRQENPVMCNTKVLLKIPGTWNTKAELSPECNKC